MSEIVLLPVMISHEWKYSSSNTKPGPELVTVIRDGDE